MEPENIPMERGKSPFRSKSVSINVDELAVGYVHQVRICDLRVRSSLRPSRTQGVPKSVRFVNPVANSPVLALFRLAVQTTTLFIGLIRQKIPRCIDRPSTTTRLYE